MKIKEQLYSLCLSHISTKAAEIKKLIDEAVEAANDETNDSAGDKFESGTGIHQQEIELNVTRMNELSKQKELLDRINPTQKFNTAQLGSLVKTNFGYYFISIGAGQLKVDGTTYFAVSPSSPAGEKLNGKKSGETFVMNGRNFEIESVF